MGFWVPLPYLLIFFHDAAAAAAALHGDWCTYIIS